MNAPFIAARRIRTERVGDTKLMKVSEQGKWKWVIAEQQPERVRNTFFPFRREVGDRDGCVYWNPCGIEYRPKNWAGEGCLYCRREIP